MQLPEIIHTPDGWTVEDASPELLSELLLELERATSAAGAPIADVLQPGVGRQYIVDQLGAWLSTVPH